MKTVKINSKSNKIKNNKIINNNKNNKSIKLIQIIFKLQINIAL
jgi:hypothetical protein